MNDCLPKSTYQMSELKCNGLIMRLIVLVILAVIVGWIVNHNKDWYNSLKKANGTASNGWMIALWIVFAVFFLWFWTKSDMLSAGHRWAGIFNVGVLVLLFAWAISFFWVHDTKAANAFIVGAIVMMAAQILMVWKLCRAASIVGLLLLAWMIYIAVVYWHANEKEDCCDK